LIAKLSLGDRTDFHIADCSTCSTV
jgi:hypothetical protein